MGLKISLDEELAPMTIEKNKILGAVLELPAKQPCRASQFASFLRWMGRFGKVLAGSSKTAPRILILLIVMGADSSSKLESIPT